MFSGWNGSLESKQSEFLALQSVYIETTIPSYLTAWPAKGVVAAAHQAITREWWQKRRGDFHLFTSQVVVLEASRGDQSAAQLRLSALEGIPRVSLTEEVEWMGSQLAQLGLVPPNAEADGFHIAFTSVYAIDYLLTWNCRHIANAERLPAIRNFLVENGYFVPVICTPEELMGDHDESE